MPLPGAEGKNVKMKNKVKKWIAVWLAISLVTLQTLPVGAVLAQEAQTQVENTATLDNTVNTSANTGDNTIGQTTPTPTPTELQEPPLEEPQPDLEEIPESTQEASLVATNSAEVTNTISAEGNSGNNQIHEPSSQTQSSSEETPDAAITTANAVSLTNVDNAVNTTEINSQVVYQTINLYVEQNGDIDLTLPSELAKSLAAQNPDLLTINAAVASVASDATVTNTVEGSANTGGNSVQGDSATIHTGDAIALLSILNRINFVMIDSVVHVVVLNIFDNLMGNILLPDLPTATPTPCPECGSLTVENRATVTNTVEVTADSGNNTLTANGGEITTGAAGANVNIINLVNTVLYGTTAFQLYILDHGLWDGTFLGWASSDGATNANLLVDPNATLCPSCIAGAQILNDATVTNTIRASATTGENTASGDSAGIETGDAYASAAVLNFVNTSLIRSFGFYGFINILGSWTGDIGSKSLFPTPTPEPEPEAVAEQAAGGAVREPGGLLTMTQTNNVGAHVNPGDTVTFFLTLKNPGNGRVFDTDLSLHLFKDGVDVGGTTIPVGTLKIGGTAKVTTGLVLSASAPGGPYVAHAVATGHVGAGSDTVSAAADSSFLIASAVAGAGDGEAGTVVVAGAVPTNVRVMGATTKPTDNPNILLALLVLLLLVPEYIFYRATKERKLFRMVFTSDLDWQSRLRAMQTLLL